MPSWLVPANTKFFNVLSAFTQHETFWPMNAKISPGDIVYIYLAVPIKQIGFRCEVIETGYECDTIRDLLIPFIKGDVSQEPSQKPFMRLGGICTAPAESESVLSLSKLRENGLNGVLMGARKLDNNQVLFDHIRKAFA